MEYIIFILLTAIVALAIGIVVVCGIAINRGKVHGDNLRIVATYP